MWTPDPLSLGTIALVVFLTGISKSAFAGALGVFSVPLLVLVMPVQQGVGLMLPLLLLADAFSLRSHWRQWDWSLLKRLLPGLLVGIAIGSLMLGKLSSDLLRLAIGLFSLLFALRYLLFRHLHSRWLAHSHLGSALAAVSGISSTLLHAGGPPLMVHLLSLPLSPTRLVATSMVLYAVMNLIKLVPYLAYEVLTLNLLGWALLFAPLAWVGNRLGIWLRNRIEPGRFLTALHGLLLLMGVKLLLG